MNHEIINRKKKELGLTNAQIAELTGVTLSTIDKITSGANKNPKLDTLYALADVLGLTLDDFDDRQKPAPAAEVLYISHPSGDASADEIRKYLHEVIDQLPDEDLVLFKDITLRMKRE